MKLAVVGAGSVGRALMEALDRLGHEVRAGVRDPDDPKHADLVGATSPTEAVADAQLVVLAVPVGALADILGEIRLEPTSVVVDATNAVGAPPPDGYATVGAYVRSLVDPEVPVVKAFNTIGAEHMVDGTVADTAAFLPVAGDPAGVDVVVELATAIGFDAVPVGGLDEMGLVEDHARLWIHLMRSGWGRDFGFGLLRGDG